MSLNFDKLRDKKLENGNIWSSYSDLFMALSLIFLLLYVTSSLRNGTREVQKHVEMQRITAEAEDLREQIRVYNTLKEEYLANQADEDERQVYKTLMDKLTLLREETREERQQLEQRAQENQKKEFALNQYQQIVRNIVNANLLAKKGLQQRDRVIERKTKTITEAKETIAVKEASITQKEKLLAKTEDILKQTQEELDEKRITMTKLEQDVNEKEQSLEEKLAKLQSLKSELSAKEKTLKKTRRRSKSKRKELAQQIAMLKKQSSSLDKEKARLSQELGSAKEKLDSASDELQDAKATIAKRTEEKQRLAAELEQTAAKYAAEMNSLQSDFKDQIKRQQADFEKKLEGQKLSEAAKRQQAEAFAAKMQRQKQDLNERLASLANKIGDTEAKLAEAKAKADQHKNYIASLEREKADLNRSLNRSQAVLRQKKELAKRIKDRLEKAGLQMTVDEETGDVILSFGKEYFETNESDLKPGMEEILRKFIPIYSRALLEDEKVAAKLEFVEVVGFASPTYRGKYVDPKSLDSKDRQAVDYNLDLSYRRAKSIFNYIFDTDKMTYKYQKQLLPLVKVTGRSYLSKEVKGRDVKAGVSTKEFCQQFNCLKEQKVVIKFDLMD